jgi:hypothetical protein
MSTVKPYDYINHQIRPVTKAGHVAVDLPPERLDSVIELLERVAKAAEQANMYLAEMLGDTLHEN